MDGVIIGGLMILVPGLLFTNAMRDIILGDTNSGIYRLVQVILIALAMAIGTAAAFNAATSLWHAPVSAPAWDYSLIATCFASVVGCIGFSVLFNIHGPGGILCAMGGVVSWAIYSLVTTHSGSQMLGYLWGAIFASAYAEIMARVRKYPAISYLVVSLFPLIPGASVYYTMNYAVQGDMEQFAAQGMYTGAITGVIAVGVLLVSSIVRFFYIWKQMRAAK